MTDEAQSETPEYLIETNPSALEEEVEVFARLLRLLVVPPALVRGPMVSPSSVRA